MKLNCKKCGYEWEYKGKSEWYAQCPMCRYVNKLKEGEEE